MIESIRIQNYKALRDVTLRLTPIHVLIGKNDSGKTSILEAISALCRSVDHELSRAFVGRWSGTELVWKQHRTNLVEFDAVVSDSSFRAAYELKCRFRESGRIVESMSEVIRAAGTPYQIGADAARETAVNRFARDPDGYGKNQPVNKIRAVHSLLSGVRTCRWSAEMLSLPVAYEGHVPLFDLAPNGFGLPLLLDDILGNDLDKFVKLKEQFRRVFAQLKEIRLVREEGFKLPPDDAEGVPKLKPGSGKGLRFDFENGGSDVPASQVSSGLLILLAYLANLYSPHPPRVLLIEEPENGVHPERLVEIITLIREIVARHSTTQIVLTTHSPHLLSQFSADEVTLCHKEPDGSVSLHRLSESASVQKQSSIFTLGEIWTGEGDDDLAKSTSAAETTSP